MSMANVRTVGPLRMWTAHGSHGRTLIVEIFEITGARQEYRDTDAATDPRAAQAWQAYRERDSKAAYGYAGRVAPEYRGVRACARCGAFTALTEYRPNGDTYPLCTMCLPLTPEERLLCAVAGVGTLPELNARLHADH
jgi:hypothetical protein